MTTATEKLTAFLREQPPHSVPSHEKDDPSAKIAARLELATARPAVRSWSCSLR